MTCVAVNTNQPTPIGHRRSKSWWEPIYDPQLENSLASCDWQFSNSTGPENSFLSAAALKEVMVEGEVKKISGMTFRNCDFQGEFAHNPSILFDSCRFHNCDFGFSTWSRVNFRRCEFSSSSISLATFKECEFRECSWKRIGLSGSKTEIDRSFITNPQTLVKAGYSGTNPVLGNDRQHAAYQAYRLEETKAHLARSILLSHQSVGDDDTYYKTARLHDLQQVKYRISRTFYNVRYADSKKDKIAGLSVVFWSLEMILLRLVGFTNGWGARLFQPLLMLFLCFLVFGALYHVLPQSSAANQPWQRSFDVTGLAGYSNQSSASEPLVLRAVVGIQLILSIFFYTIFFSTAVARFSRAR